MRGIKLSKPWRHIQLLIFKVLLPCLIIVSIVKLAMNVYPYQDLWINKDSLPQCSIYPPNLEGRIPIVKNVTVEDAEMNITNVEVDGTWWPSHCKAIWRVAIIVPYRNRYSHIGPFLMHMHQFLQKQELNYSIYIIDQYGEEPFNRGRLLNAGFLESQKDGPWDCFAFHDIDLLPEDDRHLYHCSVQPRHLVIAPSQFNYRYLGQNLGCACLMTADQIYKVNGWSNKFWGWGGEDNDMRSRVTLSGMSVWSYPPEIGRYTSFSHSEQPRNNERYEILKRVYGKHKEDGLNNFQYAVRNIKRNRLYAHIVVYIGHQSEGNTPTKTNENNTKKP